MKAVALDIGAGTVDFLLYDDGKPLENCVKMVLPSTPRVFATRIRKSTEEGVHLFIDGYTIGGGSLASAIRNHLREGLPVYMTPRAAYSIRNDLDEVRSMGVQVVEEEPDGFNGMSYSLDEIRLDVYEELLRDFSETLLDVDFVAITVKDHGAAPPGMSNRLFRLNKFREMLSEDNRLERFLFHEKDIPGYFLRMRSAVESSKSFLPGKEVFVMDTSSSAVNGCLGDYRVAGKNPVLAVNVGNGHTMAAVVSDGRVLGFFEHHTRSLTGDKLVGLIKKLGDGTLTHDEVFNDGGHGALILGDMPGFSEIKLVAVTGPRRGMLEGSGLDYVQAAPGGDVMMTGTIGIINGTIRRLQSKV
ncbi:MAG: DUF1786 domain-containing protein [Candidatus Bathyarchaeota archaeon]|nr:DUF1786 domain-containing protein [Candidatus Bathyarchaeota archaeon]